MTVKGKFQFNLLRQEQSSEPDVSILWQVFMTWPELQPHKWPRPGAKRPWTVPLVLWCAVAALLTLSPWRESVWTETLNRLPKGLSEDQVIVSRALRYSILLGIKGDAVDAVKAKTSTLYDFKLFEDAHVLARLKPGVSVWDAQKEMRELFGDRTVRVYPVRRIVMGDTHMLVAIWIIGWAVVIVRSLVGVFQNRKQWRFHVYRVSTLLALGSLLILLFGNVCEAFGYRQAQSIAWFFWFWTLFYIMLSAGLLWLWRYDTRTRCRICAEVLRLPMELGETSSMVLDVPRVELVCFEGHGALTMDRWHDDWRGYRDMWEAFSKPCM